MNNRTENYRVDRGEREERVTKRVIRGWINVSRGLKFKDKSMITFL
jgi:hypothetical protein